MNVPRIYIARHGERLDFVDPTWEETAPRPHDPPLTDTGRRQATDLGRKIHSLGVKHIFASPFTRCVNTACNVAAECGPDMKVCIEPGACEWLNAIWYASSEKGPIWRSIEDLKQEFPIIDESYTPAFPMSHNFDGFPESILDLLKRSEVTLNAIREQVKEKDGHVLVVGHGTSVESFYKTLCPDVKTKTATYCCLTECIPNEDGSKYEMGMFCDSSFLGKPQDKEFVRYI